MHQGSEVSGSVTQFARNSFELLVQWHIPYAKFLADSKVVASILDVGCGQGAFLEGCRRIKPDWNLTGLELDASLAEQARDLGHHVLIGDAIEVLSGQPTVGLFDAIHLSHIIEHLSPNDLMDLLAVCVKSLTDGGVIIVRTPNWHNPHVNGGGFWDDFSHVRPYPVAAFEPILNSLGMQPWLVGAEPYGWEDVFYMGIKQSQPVKTALLVGAVRVVHSLAKINTQLIRKLAVQGFMPRVLPTEPFAYPAEDIVMAAATSDSPYFEQAGTWIGHAWPTPSPSTEGKSYLYIPWEFYAPLQEWKRDAKPCEEIWTSSEYSARGFREYDLHPQIRVMYPRVDASVYGLEGEAMEFPEANGTIKLLFVGGTIWRKGIDVLLQAYRNAFSRNDPVTLIIKDMGNSSFYKGQTAEGMLAQYMRDPDSPCLIHSTESFSELQMASLYRGVDVLVQPYRAEGFGMPILEAMTSGIPVVVTDGGPSDEFVPDGTYIKCPAKIVTGEARVDDRPTLGPIRWLEPDPEQLSAILRLVVNNAALMRREAQSKATAVADKWGWDQLQLFSV